MMKFRNARMLAETGEKLRVTRENKIWNRGIPREVVKTGVGCDLELPRRGYKREPTEDAIGCCLRRANEAEELPGERMQTSGTV